MSGEEVDVDVDVEEGKVYWVSDRVPERTFIRQCAFAWSWRGEPFPGVQTRINCVGERAVSCEGRS